MPGLGRKTFAPGEVLRAADVNGYLMDQSVQVYAGTAARGSAIGTAASEGMISYQKDTDFIEIYDGSSWLPAVSPTAWTAYTPTFTNLTLGNGTVAFYYKRIGKTVHIRGMITFGTTTSISGASFDWTLPVASAATTPFLALMCNNIYYKSSIHNGFSVLISGQSTVRSVYNYVSGTSVIQAEVTATAPFTWASGNLFIVYGTYEAA